MRNTWVPLVTARNPESRCLNTLNPGRGCSLTVTEQPHRLPAQPQPWVWWGRPQILHSQGHSPSHPFAMSVCETLTPSPSHTHTLSLPPLSPSPPITPLLDWFPGLELGDLLEAARPDWDLDAELSAALWDPEPLPAPGQGRAGGARAGEGGGEPAESCGAARLNRLKKKQYVLGLESRLQGLAAENRQLRDRNRGLSRRLRELERESSYLRAVLANQSALGQLLSRLAGTRAGGLQLSTSLFRDTGNPRRHDHDYALPSSRPRGLEEAAVVTETEEEWAAPGGICLHVDRDQVSVEFCSICARRAAASFKM
uniref:CREB/ATF bZIP transcription factor n=1 Tax=Malurus cyaneus samueli TaxID=2593467 RepID=A0A8C5TNE0_9PASS